MFINQYMNLRTITNKHMHLATIRKSFVADPEKGVSQQSILQLFGQASPLRQRES